MRLIRLIFTSICLCGSVANSGRSALAQTPATTNSVLARPAQPRVVLDGPVARQVAGVVNRWLLRAPDDNPAMLLMFRDRGAQPPRDLLPWSGEFAGKYLTGAAEVLRLTADPALRVRLEVFVRQLLALQEPDGYLGPFDAAHRLTGRAPNVGGGWTWDAWGHYHAMLGLMTWHDVTGDPGALAACRKIGDLLDNTYGGATTVASTGNPECNQAIVHSLALLHARTGDDRYLRLARKVVAEFGADGAGDYLAGALAGKEFYQLPNRGARWESLHAVMGLGQLYRITGEERYRKAFEHHWWSIVETDRHNNGGFSSGEQAQGNPYHRGPIETCSTVAWIAMSVEMLRLSGEPRVADELELSTLNSVAGLFSPGGDWSTYNTPMDGRRVPSTEDIAFQVRPGSEQLNCCSVNAARGFGLIADWAVTADGEGFALNYYGPSAITTVVRDVDVRLTQRTDYPRSGAIEITVEPAKPISFPLKLRIPHWSANTRLAVNGRPVTVAAGTYATVEREWLPGDRITLTLDFAPRFWVGEREYEGRASVYRGPVLLAVDLARAQPAFSKQFHLAGPNHVTDVAGAAVEFSFDGDSVLWKGFRYDDAGKAGVWIDGKHVDVVDQYGPVRDAPFSWKRTGLGGGSHTLRIEVLGQRNERSKGQWVNVLEFEPRWQPPSVDAAALANAEPRANAQDLLLDVADLGGAALQLRDFATAGQHRTPYVSWLRVRGADRATRFSRANPSRTTRFAK